MSIEHESQNTIGERIHLLRKAKKVSMDVLGKAIGTNSGNISDWENDKKQPSAKFLIALSDYFGVTVDYILKGTGTSHNKSPMPITLQQTAWLINECIKNDVTVMVEIMNYGLFSFELYTRVYGAKARSMDVVLSLFNGQDIEQASRDGGSTELLSLKATDTELYARLSHTEGNCVHIDTASSCFLEGDERGRNRTFRLTLKCSHAFFLEKYEEICK
ncbi:helix-turn-helix domain-containing protein [Paenibacillus medicaginis]|uniref:Helix-turn-helix domain-containing protein n=1 Tax=Paenibacillus medicaginis TaxID=1470560 RepID=A0ABV5BXI5_9BACL